MKGFKIAIATKDKAPEDLILIGKDIEDKYDADDLNSDEEATIEKIDIFFDTIDDNVKKKSGGMLAKIEIKGKIPKNPEFMKKFRKLSEWTRDNSSETQYRDICIGVKSDKDRFQVVYSIKNVFVVDYREVYVIDDKNTDENYDRFELYLTQEQNNMDKIDIVSDWPTDWEWARKG